MLRRLLAVAVLATAAALVPGVASAQVDCGSFPDPTGYVVDDAGVVDDDVESELTSRLAAFEASSGGAQVAVLTTDGLGDRAIEDYANDVFGCWGVGAEGADTGVLLVVAMDQRRLRIEVGRGFEGELTDVEAADIVRDVVSPRFAAGSPSDGVRDGVLAILGALGVEGLPVVEAPSSGPSGPGIGLVVLVIAMVVIGGVAGGGRGGGRGGGGSSTDLLWLPILLGRGGGHRGGGGFGGGGFGGGGGGFGGFGGGSSGGGGASGGW